jgi:hypothetical protein
MPDPCRQLGDALVKKRLAVEGSNSPYATVVHCVGVMHFWAGHTVAGRPNHRDRDAEFRATGTVDDLASQVRSARRRTPIRSDGPSGALVHVLGAAPAPRGQLELTADVMRSTRDPGGQGV